MGTWREDVIWAAGLFEGEGCFTATERRNGHGWRLRAELTMTDEDVVTRFAGILDFGRVRPFPVQAGRQPAWRWQVDGVEKVQAVVAMFWPWLGERRRAKARELLLLMPGIRVRRAARIACPHGHPYDEANTYRHPSGSRICRACARQRNRESYARRVKLAS